MNTGRTVMDFVKKGLEATQPTDHRSLNCSASSTSEELNVVFMKKPKTTRDPKSHRIIEKRRRDRMNNCLADLSLLIPASSLKKGQGRIEKTEIIEMAINHIKYLTSMVTSQNGALPSSLPDRYLGFKECQDEVMRYLVEVEGLEAMDALCNRLIAHLEHLGEKFRIMNDESLSQIAKEEQYRHADEELGSPFMKPLIVEVEEHENFCNDKQSAQPPYSKNLLPHNFLKRGSISMSESSGMETSDSFEGHESFKHLQQITLENLKRDIHLWKLPFAKNKLRMMDDSGLSTGSTTSASNQTDFNKYPNPEQDGSARQDLMDVYKSKNSSNMGESGSDQSGSMYKFKHAITKRFSQGEKTRSASDTSSSSYNEGKGMDNIKRKFRHQRFDSPSNSPSSSGSSRYPNSDSSNNRSGSSICENGNSIEETKNDRLIPGFVLHTTGTHYIPLSIHPSNKIKQIFSKNKVQAPSVYHPVSITVDFGGPLLFLEKLNTGPTTTAQSSECVDRWLSGSCSGSDEISSAGSPSESSPLNL